MKHHHCTYLFFILLPATMLLSCLQQPNSLPSLKETFSKNDKAPFGTYILYRQMGQLFYHNNINVKKQKFETSYTAIDDTGSLYINVSKSFYPGKKDNESILEYVANGNSMFISSENIDTVLLDSLGLRIANPSPFYANFLPLMKYTSVLLQQGIYTDSSLFTYFYIPFNNYFKNYDSSITTVLGRNQSGQANFIVLFYGAGRFYLHCEPRAFSNYFLLQKNNYKYLQQVFSFMPVVPQHVFWDDFYNKRNYPLPDKNKQGLAVLLQYPAMAWAFWLLLLLLALYVLFGGKRRQRMVSAIAPNVNTTVAFTETVGRLYLQKKDNRNIADKIITYLMEHIRNHYFLNTSHINDDFTDRLSRKANVSNEGVKKLFDTIHSVQQQDQVEDQLLLSLNRQTENFYKNKL